jgi:hypothetical protein
MILRSSHQISWRMVLQKPTAVNQVNNLFPSLKPKIKYCGHKRSTRKSTFIHLNPLPARILHHVRVCSDLALPWKVACLSQRQHDFSPRSTYVLISGRHSGNGTVFSPRTEVFTCKYYSTDATYLFTYLSHTLYMLSNCHSR